jgi:hypothetical protein
MALNVVPCNSIAKRAIVRRNFCLDMDRREGTYTVGELLEIESRIGEFLLYQKTDKPSPKHVELEVGWLQPAHTSH